MELEDTFVFTSEPSSLVERFISSVLPVVEPEGTYYAIDLACNEPALSTTAVLTFQLLKPFDTSQTEGMVLANG